MILDKKIFMEGMDLMDDIIDERKKIWENGKPDSVGQCCHWRAIIRLGMPSLTLSSGFFRAPWRTELLFFCLASDRVCHLLSLLR